MSRLEKVWVGALALAGLVSVLYMLAKHPDQIPAALYAVVAVVVVIPLALTFIFWLADRVDHLIDELAQWRKR